MPSRLKQSSLDPAQVLAAIVHCIFLQLFATHFKNGACSADCHFLAERRGVARWNKFPVEKGDRNAKNLVTYGPVTRRHSRR